MFQIDAYDSAFATFFPIVTGQEAWSKQVSTALSHIAYYEQQYT